MSAVPSVDPRTGAVTDTGLAQTSAAELSEAAGQAAAAGPGLAQLGRDGRARMLREMAAALEEDREQLVSMADAETGLGGQRLGGELTRTCYQLAFMSEVIEDGAYLEATIEHPRPSPMGPLPDLRRMLRPVGPVGVFGASNFPFAFSVAGGDTASALAAGCPVIIKAHEAHPATSVREAALLSAAAARVGAPPGTLALIHGRAAGVALVGQPAIQAIGFTGSLAAGRLLYDVACARPVPIPFYGELGALNAVVVTAAAAERRHQEIAAGLAASFTLSAGQFCTKPGLVLLPAGPGGARILDELTRLVTQAAAAPLLSARTADAFAAGSADRLSMPGVTQAARGCRRSRTAATGRPRSC
jgi:NADP-dependent aldehyde dehydrogenase